MDGAASRRVVRLGRRGAPEDLVAVEEPLEIRVAGETVAVTMRTPGRDAELAVGFLAAEGILASVADIGSVVPCGRSAEYGGASAIDVVPGPGVSLDVDRAQAARRGTLTTAACGVCGRRCIDDLVARCGEQGPGPAVDAAVVTAAVERMCAAQGLFAATGGAHAAAAFGAEGDLFCVHEDVGRHNAVDKVVGDLLLGRTPRGRAVLLVVSGRASFEIVQKAVAAGIPIVAAVSAPTSLAVDLAARTRTTLAAFVRGGTMSVYAAGERIVRAGRGT